MNRILTLGLAFSFFAFTFTNRTSADPVTVDDLLSESGSAEKERARKAKIAHQCKDTIEAGLSYSDYFKNSKPCELAFVTSAQTCLEEGLFPTKVICIRNRTQNPSLTQPKGCMIGYLDMVTGAFVPPFSHQTIGKETFNNIKLSDFPSVASDGGCTDTAISTLLATDFVKSQLLSPLPPLKSKDRKFFKLYLKKDSYEVRWMEFKLRYSTQEFKL